MQNNTPQSSPAKRSNLHCDYHHDINTEGQGQCTVNNIQDSYNNRQHDIDTLKEVLIKFNKMLMIPIQSTIDHQSTAILANRVKYCDQIVCHYRYDIKDITILRHKCSFMLRIV